MLETESVQSETARNFSRLFNESGYKKPGESRFFLRNMIELEFKQETVRLVRGGQAASWVAETLGISGQTLHN
jgi:hypothetical protein